MKIGRFAFLRPPLGDLGATYDDHLRLIGKRVVDFLLALIELFSPSVTAKELRAIIGWKSAISFQWGSVDPKFHLEGVAPHQPFFFSKNRINVLSYGIKIWTDLSSVLSQSTRVTDGQTDRQTDRNLLAIPRLHYMQRGKNICTVVGRYFTFRPLFPFFMKRLLFQPSWKWVGRPIVAVLCILEKLLLRVQ